jgi:hypothetical protein
MGKIFSLLLYFFKEIVFDNKEEYNFKSSKFNTRKFIVLIIVMLSVLVAVTMTSRTYALAKTNLELKENCEICKKNKVSDSSNDKKSK